MKRLHHAATFVAALAAWGAAETRAAGAPPVRAPISIDGNISDWEQVLLCPTNSARDGEGHSIPCAYSLDRDCSLNSGGNDLARFAWTWSPTTFYYYFERYTPNGAWAFLHLYLDVDDDGLMETGEPVLTVRMNSPGSSSSTTLDRYAATTLLGDPLANPQGIADGCSLPGSTGSSCCAPLEGPVAGGLAFEGGVSWFDLGVPPFSPMGFHVATSDNAIVPVMLRDNMGGTGGAAGTTAYRLVDLSPSREAERRGARQRAESHHRRVPGRALAESRDSRWRTLRRGRRRRVLRPRAHELRDAPKHIRAQRQLGRGMGTPALQRSGLRRPASRRRAAGSEHSLGRGRPRVRRHLRS